MKKFPALERLGKKFGMFTDIEIAIYHLRLKEVTEDIAESAAVELERLQAIEKAARKLSVQRQLSLPGDRIDTLDKYFSDLYKAVHDG